MTQLVDPRSLRLVSAVCSSGGVALHSQSDCPRDRTCPVYASFHRLPLTFAEAKEEIGRLMERDRATYIAMRREASLALEADMHEMYGEDSGYDIGSSDVSIRVIDMYRYGEMEV